MNCIDDIDNTIKILRYHKLGIKLKYRKIGKKKWKELDRDNPKWNWNKYEYDIAAEYPPIYVTFDNGIGTIVNKHQAINNGRNSDEIYEYRRKVIE